jgi:hypothetical protein
LQLSTNRKGTPAVAWTLLLLALAAPAKAVEFTGVISMLEVWPSGNVAFTLAGAAPCNGQFILNASAPGTKNMYAALLAAKHAVKPVRIYHSSCGVAEGGAPNYALVGYLYVED